jgi:hypothetical protein
VYFYQTYAGSQPRRKSLKPSECFYGSVGDLSKVSCEVPEASGPLPYTL